MPKFDKFSLVGGNTNASPNAGGSLTPSSAGEVTLVYGLNSNSAVAQFAAPWNNILLNVNAFGKFAWQRTLNTAPVGAAWTVAGTQAWAALMAAFGSSANPIFTSKANGSNAFPFSAAGLTFTAGKVLIAVLEFTANGSNQVPASISDSVGDLWLGGVAFGQRNGPLGQLAQVNMFYVESAVGGAGVTVNFTGGGGAGNPAPVWAIYEVDNLAPVVLSTLRLLSMTGVGI